MARFNNHSEYDYLYDISNDLLKETPLLLFVAIAMNSYTEGKTSARVIMHVCRKVLLNMNDSLLNETPGCLLYKKHGSKILVPRVSIITYYTIINETLPFVDSVAIELKEAVESLGLRF
ncbi:hypothetical protein VNO78_03735 [Psophocarpus tetragonolobus]|uniref:Uncharacterized protein n=1 Tax=Psophocarpus tetragonolobus TaxID=3891 RepID=A0AAN9T4V5_PSOTE